MSDPIEECIRNAIIGEVEAPDIVVADYDPVWPERFRREAAKIQGALGDAALAVEHIGSTSVPGLAAKPIIDILLVVEDSGDEPSYLPALVEAGYVLRVREKDFYEHRMLRTPEKGRARARFLAGIAGDKALPDAPGPPARGRGGPRALRPDEAGSRIRGVADNAALRRSQDRGGRGHTFPGCGAASARTVGTRRVRADRAGVISRST